MIYESNLAVAGGQGVHHKGRRLGNKYRAEEGMVRWTQTRWLRPTGTCTFRTEPLGPKRLIFVLPPLDSSDIHFPHVLQLKCLYYFLCTSIRVTVSVRTCCMHIYSPSSSFSVKIAPEFAFLSYGIFNIDQPLIKH